MKINTINAFNVRPLTMQNRSAITAQGSKPLQVDTVSFYGAKEDDVNIMRNELKKNALMQIDNMTDKEIKNAFVELKFQKEGNYKKELTKHFVKQFKMSEEEAKQLSDKINIPSETFKKDYASIIQHTTKDKDGKLLMHKCTDMYEGNPHSETSRTSRVRLAHYELQSYPEVIALIHMTKDKSKHLPIYYANYGLIDIDTDEAAEEIFRVLENQPEALKTVKKHPRKYIGWDD